MEVPTGALQPVPGTRVILREAASDGKSACGHVVVENGNAV